ncbi:norsolorinic acid reductase-like [Plakobranchus ocellatus]|uniref:Norsolorinic acid reductase-like n=1 Tax=Plakobranchus ocellatus TaxID=259542 RepID=A0AAV4DHF3_9GAST|nr:norsolorinic acid reductase-like [Plakobranchus ocellatus]
MADISEKSKVKYNFVGKSGLKVSNICLGTLTFGESPQGRPGQSDEILSHQILDRFAAYGGNFIDTADIYVQGISEKILGTWLERPVSFNNNNNNNNNNSNSNNNSNNNHNNNNNNNNNSNSNNNSNNNNNSNSNNNNNKRTTTTTKKCGR